MRDMHKEDHRRMFTAKSKKGHECSCHYTARIQGGFFFFLSGVLKKSEPPQHQSSLTGKRHNRGNSKQAQPLFVEGVQGARSRAGSFLA